MSELSRAPPASRTSQPTADVATATLLPLVLAVAALIIGWALFVASLLYVVSEYSMTVWLLTALGLAVAHVVCAVICWQYATLPKPKPKPKPKPIRG